MSGTQWIYLEGIDCSELPAIGIPVLVDNGRQTKTGHSVFEGQRQGGENEGRGWREQRKNNNKKRNKRRE